MPAQRRPPRQGSRRAPSACRSAHRPEPRGCRRCGRGPAQARHRHPARRGRHGREKLVEKRGVRLLSSEDLAHRGVQRGDRRAQVCHFRRQRPKPSRSHHRSDPRTSDPACSRATIRIVPPPALGAGVTWGALVCRDVGAVAAPRSSPDGAPVGAACRPASPVERGGLMARRIEASPWPLPVSVPETRGSRHG